MCFRLKTANKTEVFMKRILALIIFHVSLDPLLLFSFFEDEVMEGLGDYGLK